MDDYIIAIDDSGQPYIEHAFWNRKGSIKKNHKYIKKISDGIKTRYFYTKKELDAYYDELKKKAEDAADKTADKVKNKTKNISDNTRKSIKSALDDISDAAKNASRNITNASKELNNRAASSYERMKKEFSNKESKSNNSSNKSLVENNIPEKVIKETVIPEKVIKETVIPEKVLKETVIPEKVLKETVIPEKVLKETTWSNADINSFNNTKTKLKAHSAEEEKEHNKFMKDRYAQIQKMFDDYKVSVGSENVTEDARKAYKEAEEALYALDDSFYDGHTSSLGVGVNSRLIELELEKALNKKVR